jgi:hypothetical protein
MIADDQGAWRPPPLRWAAPVTEGCTLTRACRRAGADAANRYRNRRCTITGNEAALTGLCASIHAIFSYERAAPSDNRDIHAHIVRAISEFRIPARMWELRR